MTVPANGVRVVHPGDGEVEQYRIILPRRDGKGWKAPLVRGPEGRIELVSPEICGAKAIRLSVVTLEPGYSDKPHFHVNGEKVMYFTAGTGCIRVSDGDGAEDSIEVAVGDAVYVPPF